MICRHHNDVKENQSARPLTHCHYMLRLYKGFLHLCWTCCIACVCFDRIEDHDDLTPIFNRQSDMLSRTYGDFFLGELIDAQDDHMHCLVAEVKQSVVVESLRLHSCISSMAVVRGSF